MSVEPDASTALTALPCTGERFDGDHVGAEVGQVLRCGRPLDEMGELSTRICSIIALLSQGS